MTLLGIGQYWHSQCGPFEAAKAAADTVRVTYATEKPNVETDLKADDEPDVVPTYGRFNASTAKASGGRRGRFRKRAS